MRQSMFLLGVASLVVLWTANTGFANYGAFDPSFDPDLSLNGSVQHIAVQPDQRLVIAGTFTQVTGVPRAGLARLHPDGSLDTSFDAGTGIQGGALNVLRLQEDGCIVLGGMFSGVNGLFRPRVARLLPDGRVDRDFHAPIPEGTAIINDLILQNDGRIVIAGNFTELGGVARANLARLLPDGALDLSFNPPGGGSPIYSLMLQGDQSLLAGANRFQFGEVTEQHLRRDFIARFSLTDGSWDSSFQFQPVAGSGINSFTYPRFFLPLPGGDVLLGGMTGVTASFAFAGFIKMNAEGVMDGDFQTGPVQQTATVGRLIELGIRLPSGHLLGAGRFNTVQGQGRTNVVVLQEDGSLDPSFDPGEGTNMGIQAVAVQADGRIVIGGTFTTVDGESRPYLARLRGPGSAPLILRQPINQTLFSGEDAVFDLDLVGDPEPLVEWFREGNPTPVGTGRRWVLPQVAVLSHTGEYYAVASNTHGQATSAVVTLTVEVSAPEFTQQPMDLRISQNGLAVLSAHAVGSQPITYQWYVNGSPVDGGSDGIFEISPAFVTGPPFEGAPIGTYHVVAQNAIDSRTSASAEYRFSSVCVVDPSFFTVEELIREVFGCPTGCSSLTSQFQLNGTQQISLGPDGRVFAAGNLTHWSAGVIALQPDGSVDYGFLPGPAPDVRPSVVLALPNGQVMVGGNFTHFGGVSRGKLARLNPNGSVDESFLGEVVGSGRITRILRQNDGRLVIGGTFTNINGVPRRAVARLHPNGVLDESFELQTTSTGGFSVDGLAVMSDGKMVVGGFAQGGWRFPGGYVRHQIFRVHSNGSFDESFEAAIQAPSGGNSYLNDLLVLPDGRIYVVGRLTAVAGIPRNRIARLLPDGEVDLAFDPGVSSGEHSIHTLLVDDLGRVLVAGSFPSFGGQAVNGVARLWPDGQPDLSFGRLYGASGSTVHALALQPDGRLLIGGNVTSPRFRCYRPDIETYCMRNTNPPEVGVTRCVFRAKADGLFRIFAGDGTVSPPVIVNHPQDAFALGQSTTLTVDVVGTPQLTFQWFRNGIAIPNSNNSMLGIPADRLGAYHVEVSNEYGTATSLPAQVRGLSTFAEHQILEVGAHGVSLTLAPPTGQEFTAGDLEQLLVEGSRNLQNWQPLINALQLINGRIEITDPDAQDFDYRFYRYVLDLNEP